MRRDSESANRLARPIGGETLRLVAASVAAWLCIWPASWAGAVITLDADFDSGSLCLTPSNACDDNGVASSVNGNVVTLIGRDNFNAGQWKWVYFQASGVTGQVVNFEIGDDFTTGSANLVGHKMVYSYDQQNWSFFDNNALLGAQNKFVFSNNAAFTEDTVYVAYGLPYPYQRTVDDTGGIASSPWVSPTTSGNGTLVVGQSPGGVDDIGRAIAARNLYGFKITDAAASGPKKKIVVSSGVHANETVGNWTLEGLIEFLVSDELAAAQLRRYAEFYVYPMVNPDGRFAGNNRTTVQVDDVDPNRAWNPPSYVEPGNTSTVLDVARVGNAMRSDTGQDIDYMIDFHSTVNHSIPYHHGLILAEWQSDPFWLAVRSREPAVLTAGAALVDFTAAKFGRDVLGAEFSATFETLFVADENVDRFLDLGRNFGLAWHDVFHVAADLNFDGVLNGQDWLAFVAAAETDLAGLSSIERYERGDLDGDGVNSILDFVLFKQIYLQEHGAGAFEAMLRQVPEPNAVSLVLSSGLVLAAVCAHSRRGRPIDFQLLTTSEG